MSLQRYDLVIRQAGNHMEKRTDGGWVDADEAQAEIDRLRSALRKIIDLPNGVVVGHVSLWRKAVQISAEAIGV